MSPGASMAHAHLASPERDHEVLDRGLAEVDDLDAGLEFRENRTATSIPRTRMITLIRTMIQARRDKSWPPLEKPGRAVCASKPRL